MAHSSTGHILCGFPEAAPWHIQSFHTIGIVDAQINLYQFVINEDALDGSLNTLLAETTHHAIQIAAAWDSTVAYIDVIKQSQTYTASINSLDILIDNGFDKLILGFISGDGVEIIRSFFL